MLGGVSIFSLGVFLLTLCNPSLFVLSLHELQICSILTHPEIISCGKIENASYTQLKFSEKTLGCCRELCRAVSACIPQLLAKL